jgi:hypothetical protein
MDLTSEGSRNVALCRRFGFKPLCNGKSDGIEFLAH